MRPIAGSERVPFRGARPVRDADPSEQIEVTVVMRRDRDVSAKQHLTREEFAKQHSASPKKCEAVAQFAKSHGLRVVAEQPERRTMRLAGTVEQFSKAFQVPLHVYEYDGGSYRGRVGPVYVPDDLQDVVEAVLGLDNRPQARPHSRQAVAPPASYTPVQIASFYDFPTTSTGDGQCIALVELGGGYTDADLKAYFSGLGLQVPHVVAVPVDGAQNAPTGDVNGPDGEVMLDIEIAGAVAQSAKIAVYFAPNTDAGFLDAITAAVHDTTNKPSVVSISWGGPESTWTQQAMTSFDAAFADAGTLGITVCCASGDNGSSDGVSDGTNHVDFPSSSPNVLACGGTSIQTSRGKLTAESVWNNGGSGGATGGGISAVFALPSWQKSLSATQNGTATPLQKRGVPDIAGNADPETGYKVRIDGQDTVFGGTSAVAPLWGALVALINASRKTSAGFVNPTLYSSKSDLNDITVGNNGTFSATQGWDACTGLGTPVGTKVAGLL